MKKVLIIFVFLIAPACVNAGATPKKLISHSKQLVIVTTDNWNSTTGQLQRFERSSIQHYWTPIGKPIPVVTGRHGLGWDSRFKKTEPIVKKEGDGLTPVGVYSMGSVFGYDEKSNYKITYLPLTDASVCVDDVKSKFYNQLVNSNKVSKVDWNSAERMRSKPEYKMGTVIKYNNSPIIPGNGSCIFLHIWQGSAVATSGCIGMEEVNLQQTLNWLNSKDHPVIAILPMTIYKEVKSKWALPNLA